MLRFATAPMIAVKNDARALERMVMYAVSYHSSAEHPVST